MEENGMIFVGWSFYSEIIFICVSFEIFGYTVKIYVTVFGLIKCLMVNS